MGLFGQPTEKAVTRVVIIWNAGESVGHSGQERECGSHGIEGTQGLDNRDSQGNEMTKLHKMLTEICCASNAEQEFGT